MRSVPPVYYLFLVIIHNEHHPNTHFVVTGTQGRAMDPAIAAVSAETRDPFDTRRNAKPVHHRLHEFFLDGGGTADSGHERGLEHAWNLEG